MAGNLGRGGNDGDRLQRWTAPIFPDLDVDEDRRRLHRAACWLSDFAWTEHPDYRAEHAFTRALRMPVAQIAHHERVFIATALHTRYGGAMDDPIKAATRPLLSDGAVGEARRLGLALRLAYTLCGGAVDLLDQVGLAREAHGIVLELPPAGSLFTGEAVQRRLDALGRAFGLAARTVRRRSPSPALA
jgi:exopolyphosphatase/guanosine-5'-triphosphate,3'-diphosphate pyrophosphatase